MVMEGETVPLDVTQHPDLMGPSYPEPIWWFFMKCWDDVSKMIYTLQLFYVSHHSYKGSRPTSLSRQQLVHKARPSE